MDKLVHWEIPSTDLARSQAFYEALFGWKMQPFGDSYTVFEVEDGVGGGISKVDAVPAPCIQVYINVQDIDASLRKAESLGGKTVRGKTAIGEGMGYMAFFTDPCGCQIGLHSMT